MDKQLAIRTIKETYDQVYCPAPPENEEDMEQENLFWSIVEKHTHRKYRDFANLTKSLSPMGLAKLVPMAQEIGKELFSAESYVYDLQAEYICNEYGQEAMEKANYGNGVDDGMVSTKVYGVGRLHTTFNQNATNPDEVNADHDFEYFHSEEEE